MKVSNFCDAFSIIWFRLQMAVNTAGLKNFWSVIFCLQIVSRVLGKTSKNFFVVLIFLAQIMSISNLSKWDFSATLRIFSIVFKQMFQISNQHNFELGK